MIIFMYPCCFSSSLCLHVCGSVYVFGSSVDGFILMGTNLKRLGCRLRDFYYKVRRGEIIVDCSSCVFYFYVKGFNCLVGLLSLSNSQIDVLLFLVMGVNLSRYA